MRADLLTKVIAGYVDRGELAGAAALVWRDGEATSVRAGWRDIEAGLPVQRDTIFRAITEFHALASANRR